MQMKLFPIVLAMLSVSLYSCNSDSSSTAVDSSVAVNDSGMAVTDSVPVIDHELKPGRSPSGVITEIPLLDSATVEAWQPKYFPPSRIVKVKMLANQFTPEEVFLELLRRAGKLGKDTTVPAPYNKTYTWPKAHAMARKNKVLHDLELKDVQSLYEMLGIRFGRRVIYDLDDREEVMYNCDDLANPNPLRRDMCCGISVAAVIPSYLLTHVPQGHYTLSGFSFFGEGVMHCDQEAFIAQPAAAKCSAFVYDSVTLVTTAHDLTENSIKRYSFVFDYISLPGGQQYKTVFPESCVYKAKSARFVQGMDMCIITLDKKIDPRRKPVFSTQKPASNDTFYVIGCPMGIPLKMAGKAAILDNNADPHFFKINSDTYRGNSGSPVFNARTHQIEGFLVEGEKDFQGLDGVECSIVLNCGTPACSNRGEKVIRTSYFMQSFKK